MSEAPERVWMDPDLQFDECEKQYFCDIEYVREDLYKELDAKLAKATDALEHLVHLQSGNPATGIQANNWLKDARATLEELKGGKG